MVWTKKKLDQETLNLQPRDKDEITIRGLRRGRPIKPKMIKTNLDLSEDLAEELDLIAEFMGSTRQGIVKGFILIGLKDFYSFNTYRSTRKKVNVG